MSLVPWRRKRAQIEPESRPETALARMRSEMESLFDRFLRDPWGAPPAERAAFPRTDLCETENEVTVVMELPGVDPRNVEINVTGGMLTVRGEKKQQKEEKQGHYHYVERSFGSFHRSVQLPSSADTGQVDATYKDGVLTIKLPKSPTARGRRIPVKAS